MKRILLTLLACLLVLPGLAAAQERHNSLAIDNALVDDAGPYYFVSFGDSSNAYAKAALLADAMNLVLSYDADSKTLVFQGGTTTARLQITSDVATGLVKRSGVLSVDGSDIPSPMGIVVAGTSYVAITPIAKAFGWQTGWNSGPRVITLDPPAPPSAPEEAPAAAVGRRLSGLRIGAHDDFTRVALDMTSGQTYEVAVRDTTLVVTFPGAAPASGDWQEQDDHLQRVYLGSSAGQTALVVQSRNPLGSDGSGFRFGLTETGTLYVDLGPGLRGQNVAKLVDDDPTEPVAAAPAPPTEIRRVVVIDPGHGGKFGGAQGYAAEEDVVLAVALKLRALLEAQGIEVILTRNGDDELSQDYVQDLAARARMATPERNLFISIHANAADSKSANGVETWVFGKPLDGSTIERAIEENGGGALGEAITRQVLEDADDPTRAVLRETQLNYSLLLADAVQTNLVQTTGARDRGVQKNVFYVIRNATTPAVLVEIGFVTNPDEGSRLGTDAYQSTIARGLAQGIVEFLEHGGMVASR